MIRVRLAAVSLIAIMVAAATCMALMCPASALAETADVLASYRKHLADLQSVVADCQKQRTPTACDGSRLGGDDTISLKSGDHSVQREIRYDWLRALLLRAASKEEPPAVAIGVVPAIKHQAQPVNTLLTEAQKRLADDAKQTEGALTSESAHPTERKALSAILARREYQTATGTTLRERLLEWCGNILDRIFARLVGIGSRVPWLAVVLRGLFIAVVCLALAWMLVRIERRSRIRLVSDSEHVPNAPSAREWQLWLTDARNMAAQGAWREAIHFLYWSVISRLESRHVWPADRARTPREYLRLVLDSDPRKENLTMLTRSFEQTWYGGRSADSGEFESAERVAEQLGVK